MRVKREDSMVWYVMHEAVKPPGITHADMPERFYKGRENLSNSMMKLVKKGLVTSTREGKFVRYTATPEQLQKYIENGYHVQKQAHRATLRVGQQRVVADWDADAPAYFPTDANGRPLYKITVAPTPPRMLKTNTFSGAY